MSTLVTLLIDRAGPTAGHADASQAGLDTWLAMLRRSGPDIRVSLALAGSDGERSEPEWVEIAQPVSEVRVPRLAGKMLRDELPLVDAAIETILAVEAQVAEQGDARVVIAIQAGGAESGASRRGWAELRSQIRLKRDAGWKFILLGAGIDVYPLGRHIGIGSDRTLSHGNDHPAYLMAFSACACNIADFARGSAPDLCFSTGQKMAAGDASHMPGYAADPLGLPRLRRRLFGGRWSGRWVERLRMTAGQVFPCDRDQPMIARRNAKTPQQEAVENPGFRRVCFKEIL